MTEDKSTFFISYADLILRVTAPKEWLKYFRKLYENSEVLNYSEIREKGKVSGTLSINIIKSDDIFIGFQASTNFRKFKIKATNTPIFLFPSAHQFIARIFNILFHLNGGFVLHSSSILVGEKAILFVGESGRGKSTIVDLIHSSYSRYQILSDNSVFIKKIHNNFVVYPSPYMEANRLNFIQNKFFKKPPFKISTVFFPYHAKYNKVSELSFNEKIELLQKNSHIPYRPEKLFSKKETAQFGRLLFDFVDSLDMYKLEFVNNRSVISKIKKYG